MNNNNNTVSKSKLFYLGFKWVAILLVYYLIVFCAGLLVSITSLLPEIIYKSTPSIFQLGLTGSIGTAMTGSSIYYIRKLYKLCFNGLRPTDTKESRIEKLGTIIYFIARPLFAVGFAILVVIGVRAGLIVITDQGAEVNEGFIYLVMFISFFVGFQTGQFIRKLEASGESILNSVLPKNEN